MLGDASECRLYRLAGQLRAAAGASAAAAAATAEVPLLERIAAAPLAFTNNGRPLAAVGELCDSTHALHDGAALRAAMAADGYVLLRGLLHRPTVEAARAEVLRRMADEGMVDEHGRFRAGAPALSFLPDVTVGNEPLHAVLRRGPIMHTFERMLGGPCRCLDYTWYRAKSPGPSTSSSPHCDSIYMGRGTADLYTCWTPFSDVSLEMGGLMLCEGSHLRARGDPATEPLAEYSGTDVDSHCAGDAASVAAVANARAEGRQFTAEEGAAVGAARSTALHHKLAATGQRSAATGAVVPMLRDAHSVLEAGIGPRWLTSEFEMGDVTDPQFHFNLSFSSLRIELSGLFRC